MFLSRSIGSVLRGKATKPQVFLAALLAGMLGFVPGFFLPGEVIGLTVLDLLTDGTSLAAAQAEFRQRTGGGIGGSKWVAPLLPRDFEPPVHYRWPEYVTTARGREEWTIPLKG